MDDSLNRELQDFLNHMAFLHDGFYGGREVHSRDLNKLNEIAEKGDLFDIMAAIESKDNDRLVEALDEVLDDDQRKAFMSMIRGLVWFPAPVVHHNPNPVNDEEEEDDCGVSEKDFITAVNEISNVLGQQVIKDDLENFLDEMAQDASDND